MTETTTLARNDAAIRSLVEARSRALSAKDPEAVADCQTPDIVCYTLAPPLADDGGIAGLDAWFDTWDGPLGFEMRDLTIAAGEDVAFAHGLVRMTGRKHGGADVGLWFRLTLGMVRTGAGWKIAHEHQSVPFYMDGSLRAAVDLKP
jgi:PhnB protein